MARLTFIASLLVAAAIGCTSPFISQGAEAAAALKKTRIASVVFPEHGHFSPLTAILQAAVDKGDEVVIYAPEFFIPKNESGHPSHGPQPLTVADVAASNGTKVLGGSVRYVSLGSYSYAAFDDSFFTRLVEANPLETLGEVNTHMHPFMQWVVRSLKAHFDANPSDVPDVFLVDYGSNAAVYVAEALKVPAVISWPMTLTFPFSSAFNVPFMSFPFSAEQTLIERWVNILVYLYAAYQGNKDLGRANSLRAELGLPPTDVYHLIERNPVITPSIYGFEITQPLCPNIFPVGMLLQPINGTVDDSWNSWLDSSCKRFVYINMGSVAVLPKRWDGAILNFSIAMANKPGTCVIWKRRALVESKLVESQLSATNGAKDRLRIIRMIPFSPRHLLFRKEPKVFVTHCGDTSVLESIEAHTPMVGIPLFADQPNVCARIKDAEVGTFIDKNELTSAKLMTAVEDTFADEAAIVRRLKFLHSTAKAQGLAPRAAEVMRFIASLGYEGAKALNCKHFDEPWYRIYDVDVMVGVSVVAWSVIIFTYYFCKCCLCRCCGRGGCGASKKAAAGKQKVE